MKKRKLIGKISQLALVEHFIGGVIDLKPITLTGFENRKKLRESDIENDDIENDDIENDDIDDDDDDDGGGKKNIEVFKKCTMKAGGFSDEKDSDLPPTFQLYFSTYLTVPVDILEFLRETFKETENIPANWIYNSGDANSIKKNLQMNLTKIQQLLNTLQQQQRLIPGYTLILLEKNSIYNTAYSRKNTTKLGANPNAGKVGKEIVKQNYGSPIDDMIRIIAMCVQKNVIDKPLSFKYIVIAYFNGKEGITYAKHKKMYKEIYTEYGKALSNILFKDSTDGEDRTYFTFSLNVPSGARKMNTKEIANVRQGMYDEDEENEEEDTIEKSNEKEPSAADIKMSAQSLAKAHMASQFDDEGDKISPVKKSKIAGK